MARTRHDESLAPDAVLLCQIGLRPKRMLIFDAKVAGFDRPLKVLIDSGASENYARRRTLAESAALAPTLASSTPDASVHVKLANGSVVIAPRVVVELAPAFAGFDAVESFYVMDLDDRYDLILGISWLSKHEPWIDWKRKTIGRSVPPRPQAANSVTVCHEPSAVEPVALLPTASPLLSLSNTARPAAVEAASVGCDAPGVEKDNAVKSSVRPSLIESLVDGASSYAVPESVEVVPDLEEASLPGSLTATESRSVSEDAARSEGIVPPMVSVLEGEGEDSARQPSRRLVMLRSHLRLLLAGHRRRRLPAALRSVIRHIKRTGHTLKPADVDTRQPVGLVDADELVLSTCDLSELPAKASDIVAMPEWHFRTFEAAMRRGEVRSIAVIRSIDELDLMSSSTEDTDVDPNKQSRFESQSWDALKNNPYIDLLREFADVFPDEVPCKLPKDKGFRHEIDLKPGTKWCVTRQWPLPREQVEAIDAFFAARHKAGHVRESTSPHSSPTFCVKKATGGWRIVHAFNKLNDATIPAQTPIPRKDDIIRGMAGSSIFSTLDLRDGFYQILMRLSDIPLTAVSTPSGMLWEWLVMPQGLSNAPATFNRVVQAKLRSCRTFAPSYFDDIYVHSRPEGSESAVDVHRRHLRRVLEILRENELYANLKKCMFGVPEIPVLGDFVGVNGCRADPEKIKAIADWPVPSNAKELRQWLGLATYLHKFTKNYASMVHPLTALLKKDAAWSWTTEHQDAFDGIKESLVSAPVLALPDFERPFSVVCDASDYALGCCLMQRDAEGRNRPISYQSRKLQGAELNYPVHDKELLAMKYALVKFRVYLLGSTPFVIYTDHASLRTATKTPHLSQRMARWLSFFEEYNFTVEYKPGRENVLADALSRRPDLAATQERELNAVSRATSDLPDRLRAAYQDDSECKSILDLLESHAASPASLARKFHRYSLVDGLLYFQTSQSEEPRLVVPADEQLRNDIVFECHDSNSGGHLGREKTHLRVSSTFWWKRLYKFVARYVKTCETCQRVKPAPCHRAPLKSLPIASENWSTIGMDFIFDLPPDSKGRDGIYTMVCHRSKAVCLKAVKKSIDAEGCAKTLFKRVVANHGVPEFIVSDRDPRFTARLWQALFSLLGTKLKMSTADHPETDGLTERVHRVIEDVLRSYVQESPKTWSQHLPSVELAINTAVHASTGFSPFFLNHLRHPRLPQDLGLPRLSGGGMQWDASVRSPSPHDDTEPDAAPSKRVQATVENFVKLRKSIMAQVTDALAEAQARQEESQAGRGNLETFQVGDEVLLSTKSLPEKLVTKVGSSKLKPRYIGPFKVTAVISDVNYRIRLPKALKTHDVFYVGRLKPYRKASRSAPPPIIDRLGNKNYHVEAIVGKRTFRRQPQYLVRWIGQPDSWEPAKTIQEDVPGLVAQFEATRQ